MPPKLKYSFSVFLVAVILLSLISCGKAGSVPTSENNTEIPGGPNDPIPEAEPTKTTESKAASSTSANNTYLNNNS